MTALGVVDYGVGNMQSLANALNRVEVHWGFVTRPEEVCSFERLLLPGVGAFGPAMKRLDSNGLKHEVINGVAGGTQLLGICLGMQLLALDSEEDPGVAGLGFLDAHTRRLEGSSVGTHTGFAQVSVHAANRADRTLQPSRDFYFNHSYHVVPSAESDAVGWMDWNGSPVVAAVVRDNVAGVQFHPEKSQGQGLSVLYNFATTGALVL